MHVVWLILKIIGAVLGSLLAFLLLLILLILVVPIRYKIHLKMVGSVETESYVSWFLHIVHIRIQYKEKKMLYCFRIFGIPLRKNKEEKEKPLEKQKRKKQKRNSKKQEKYVLEEKKDLQERASKKKIKKSEAQNIEPSNAVQEDSKLDGQKESRQEDTSEIHKETGETVEFPKIASKKKLFRIHPIKKMKQLYQKIRDGIGKKVNGIKLFWFKWKRSIKSLIQKKNRMIAFLKEEGTKSSFGKIKKRLFEVLRYVLPRKMRGYIRYGTGDPCQTGQLLGAISIARTFWKTKVSIYPVFEEKIFETDLEAHGRIRVIRFVWIGGSLYFDKEIKKFIADIKQLKEELNG